MSEPLMRILPYHMQVWATANEMLDATYAAQQQLYAQVMAELNRDRDEPQLQAIDPNSSDYRWEGYCKICLTPMQQELRSLCDSCRNDIHAEVMSYLPGVNVTIENVAEYSRLSNELRVKRVERARALRGGK